MTNKDNSNKSAFDGRDRRKKKRRVEKDRPGNKLDNPIRRKSPGRRVFDRLLHALKVLDQTLKK
jgi:hypothetical protein